MGSRADAWVDRDQQERESFVEIIQERPASIVVYRNNNNDPTVGFSHEVREPSYLRTIVARIDQARDEEVRDQSVDQPQNAQWLALTDDTDVRKDDYWKWRDLEGRTRWARVMAYDPIQAGSRVQLDELRRERWPK